MVSEQTYNEATLLLGWLTLLVNVTNIVFAATVIWISAMGLNQ